MRSNIELKQDFELMAGLGDIVDVLKTASLIQFRTLQSRERPDNMFLTESEDFLSDILARLQGDHVRHPFFYHRTSLPSLMVVVSSDEGFQGEIGTQLVNTALDKRKSPNDELVVLGERGARYLQEMKLEFTAFPGLSDHLTPTEIHKVSDYLLERYRKAVGRITIVYPAFISLMAQKITVWRGLPFTGNDAAITPRPLSAGMLVEPSPVRALEGMIELWFGNALFQLLWSSKQAEVAARIMHLEGSSQELSHTGKRLQTEYFRQVHTLRDKSIREITASRQIAGFR